LQWLKSAREHHPGQPIRFIVLPSSSTAPFVDGTLHPNRATTKEKLRVLRVYVVSSSPPSLPTRPPPLDLSSPIANWPDCPIPITWSPKPHMILAVFSPTNPLQNPPNRIYLLRHFAEGALQKGARRWTKSNTSWLVDDDPGILRQPVAFLGRPLPGQTAGDGEEALQALERNPPDLLVMDGAHAAPGRA